MALSCIRSSKFAHVTFKGFNFHLGYYIYILSSKDGRLYTGYTTDLERRLKQHQKGKGAKFTRAFGAVKILYSESLADKSTALKREAAIKKMTRTEKMKLIKGR